MLPPNELQNFIRALTEGDLNLVQKTLDSGQDVNAYLDFILERPNNESYRFATPLMIASAANQLEVVEHLLNYGADPSIGTKPLHQHRKGYVPINLPLFLALEHNPDLSVATLLLERGADANQTFIGKDTIQTTYLNDNLVTYLERGSEELLIELLLDHGADPNIEAYNIYPLDLASGFENKEVRQRVIELLLKHQADPNLIVNYPRSKNLGLTLFSYVFLGKNDYANILPLFFKEGVVKPDLSLKMGKGLYKGKTIYDILIERRDFTRLKDLIIAAHLPDFQEASEFSVEQLAIYANLPDLLASLIKQDKSSKPKPATHQGSGRGGDHQQANRRAILMFHAIGAKNEACVKVLIESQPNTLNGGSYDILRDAYQRGTLGIFKRLAGHPDLVDDFTNHIDRFYDLTMTVINLNDEATSNIIINKIIGKKLDTFKVPRKNSYDKNTSSTLAPEFVAQRKQVYGSIEGLNLLGYYIFCQASIELCKPLFRKALMADTILYGADNAKEKFSVLDLAVLRERDDLMYALLETGHCTMVQVTRSALSALHLRNMSVFGLLTNYLRKSYTPSSLASFFEGLKNDPSQNGTLTDIKGELIRWTRDLELENFSRELQAEQSQVKALIARVNELGLIDKAYIEAVEQISLVFDEITKHITPSDRPGVIAFNEDQDNPYAGWTKTLKTLQRELVRIEAEVLYERQVEHERKQQLLLKERQEALELEQLKEQMEKLKILEESKKQAQNQLDDFLNRKESALKAVEHKLLAGETLHRAMQEQHIEATLGPNSKPLGDIRALLHEWKNQEVTQDAFTQDGLLDVETYIKHTKSRYFDLLKIKRDLEATYNDMEVDRSKAVQELMVPLTEFSHKQGENYETIEAIHKKFESIKAEFVTKRQELNLLPNQKYKEALQTLSQSYQISMNFIQHYTKQAKRLNHKASLQELQRLTGRIDAQVSQLKELLFSWEALYDDMTSDLKARISRIAPPVLFGHKVATHKAVQVCESLKQCALELQNALDTFDFEHITVLTLALQTKALFTELRELHKINRKCFVDFGDMITLRNGLTHFAYPYDENFYRGLCSWSNQLSQLARPIGEHKISIDRFSEALWEKIQSSSDMRQEEPPQAIDLFFSRMSIFNQLCSLGEDEIQKYPKAIPMALADALEVVLRTQGSFASLGANEFHRLRDLRNRICHANGDFMQEVIECREDWQNQLVQMGEMLDNLSYRHANSLDNR